MCGRLKRSKVRGNVAEKMRTAIFDIGAHRALMRLIEGPLSTNDLALVEEVLRALVLHDEAILEPFILHGRLMKVESGNVSFSVNPELTSAVRVAETYWFSTHPIPAKVDTHVLSVTPDQRYGLMRERQSEDIPDIKLSDNLQELARSESRAEPGSDICEVYMNSLRVLFGTVQNGGSIVCETEFFRKAVQTASAFPDQLFVKLDADWANFAKNLNTAGPLVPPVLSIALTRSASRDKIPAIVRDLRDEWAVPRSKVWALLDALKTVPTLGQAKEIESELKQTSQYFSPFDEGSSRPTQVLWDIFVSGIGGAVTAIISGGKPSIGAATGVVGRAIGEVQKNPHFGQALFGRGGFDLARRVRRELNQLERDRLRAFLNESERKDLGLSG